MAKGIIFDFNWTIYDQRIDAPMEGAVDLLESIHDKYKLCLVSCCISGITREERLKQIDELGISKYFQLIKVIKNEKTADDFSDCANEMGFKPENLLVVGDRIASEIYFGNQLGMTTVRYRPGDGKYDSMEPENKLQKADFEIKKLAEVKKILDL